MRARVTPRLLFKYTREILNAFYLDTCARSRSMMENYVFCILKEIGVYLFYTMKPHNWSAVYLCFFIFRHGNGGSGIG